MVDLLATLGQNSFVLEVLAPLFLLGFLIFIHESGHFLFAKLFGVGVEQFAFGFGPRLFGVRVGETDYRVNAIPLGGYVKMMGDDPFEDYSYTDDPKAYLGKPAWQRLFVVAAGPVFNLILPIFLFASIYMAGAPEVVAWVGALQHDSPLVEQGVQEGDVIVAVDGKPVQYWAEMESALAERHGKVGLTLTSGTERRDVSVELPDDPDLDAARRLGIDFVSARPVVHVVAGGPAAMTGLLSGDVIVAVNGEPVKFWFEVSRKFEVGQPLELSVEREGDDGTDPQTLSFTLAPGTTTVRWTSPQPAPEILNVQGVLGLEGLATRHPGLRYGLLPRELEIRDVSPGFPGEEAGLARGDVVLMIDGATLGSWLHFSRVVSTGGEVPHTLLIMRGSDLHAQEVTPRVVSDVDLGGNKIQPARIGLTPNASFSTRDARRQLTLFPALERGFRDTTVIVVTMGKILERLVLGDIPMSESIGGPISIIKHAQDSARHSLVHYLRIMAIISISLGVMNLLPIPLLDGGNFLFFSIEAVRGRPVSLRFREISHQLGFLFLVSLMLFAIINDTRLYLLK